MSVCLICSKPTGQSHTPPYPPRIYCSRACMGLSYRRVHVIKQAKEDNTIDEQAVYRLLEGWVVASTRAEKIEAVRVLTCQGRSIAWIADYLRTTTRSVERYRHEIHNRRETAA